jgi:hypothetical protein
MRSKVVYLSCVVGLLIGLGNGSSARADLIGDMIDQYLQQLGAHDYFKTPVNAFPVANGDFVGRTFPNFEFSGVYFAQYPLHVDPPEGLADSNMFWMDSDHNISYLTGPDDLALFFKANWGRIAPPETEDPLVDGAKTWLRLSQEFSQDGFFKFSEPMVEVVDGTAFGLVAVEEGGTGLIWVMMYVDIDGTLVVEEGRDIHTGIRPL